MKLVFDLWNDAPPISFLIDGEHSREVWKIATRKQHRDGNTHRLTWTLDDLEFAATLRVFDDFSAADWVLEITNRGSSDSPILEDIQALDTIWPSDPGTHWTLHSANGSVCAMDDFLPFSEHIHARERAFAPSGGRSSDGAFPWFNLQGADGGFVLGVGWTGQWRVVFERVAEGVRMRAGMEKTHFKLLPGESVRTPRILLAQWRGAQANDGNKHLRRLLMAHFCPRESSGELAHPPVAHMTMSQFHHTGWTSEENELNALQKAHDLGCEAFWVDACWYGQNGKWYENVGDWRVRRETFPNGLKPIGDAARERGMKFVLWFEPERVVAGTPFDREHPEWLLHAPGDTHNRLFDLGNDEARGFLTDMISGVIAESGVTIYRQDFNFSPLAFWQTADADDRIGISEIRHITGLYQMWDELVARYPGLLIDNCASGGRRLDLEMVARSFPLWRSDFSDVGGPEQGSLLQLGDQSASAGLARWLPFHAASVWTFSPYNFRSAMSSGVCLYCGIQGEDFPADDARRAIAELKRLRPFYTGDFYPLVTLSVSPHDWCAYQFHRADLDAGFALLLRRLDSPFPTLETALQAVDLNAQYLVSISDDFDAAQAQPMSGAQLQSLIVTIEEKPGSRLIEYRRA